MTPQRLRRLQSSGVPPPPPPACGRFMHRDKPRSRLVRRRCAAAAGVARGPQPPSVRRRLWPRRVGRDLGGVRWASGPLQPSSRRGSSCRVAQSARLRTQKAPFGWQQEHSAEKDKRNLSMDGCRRYRASCSRYMAMTIGAPFAAGSAGFSNGDRPSSKSTRRRRSFIARNTSVPMKSACIRVTRPASPAASARAAALRLSSSLSSYLSASVLERHQCRY